MMANPGKRIGNLSPGRRDKRLPDKEHPAHHLPAQVEVIIDNGFTGMKHPVHAFRRSPPADTR